VLLPTHPELCFAFDQEKEQGDSIPICRQEFFPMNWQSTGSACFGFMQVRTALTSLSRAFFGEM
jgi:hypothetical protein